MFKLSILVFSFSLISQFSNTERATSVATNFDRLDVYYIDRSQDVEDGGLTRENLVEISAQMEGQFSTANKVVLVASDGSDPKISDTKQESIDLIKDLESRFTGYLYNPFDEKKLIRNFLFNEQVEIAKEIHFHFFVSDYFCEEVIDADEFYASNLQLLKYLPLEIRQLADFNSEVIVHINYPGNSGTVDLMEFKEVLNRKFQFETTDKIIFEVKNGF